MVKTMAIDDDVHELVINKQKEIKEKKYINVQIKDIIAKLVREHLSEIDL